MKILTGKMPIILGLSKFELSFVIETSINKFYFNRKIKPVDGLILKTPIAFQKDSDLDMIPIRKEGMAVCEKCGAIGVKHSFYTKERRFCSQACAKSFNEGPHMSSSNSGNVFWLFSWIDLEIYYELPKQLKSFPCLEKRFNLLPGQQPTNRKLGQPTEDVHVYSNKKRLLLAKEIAGPDKDKSVRSRSALD